MRRLALLPHARELLEAHRRHRISPEVRLALCSRECADSPLQHANLAVDVVHTLNEQAGSLALAVDLALLLGAVLLAIALSARGVQRPARSSLGWVDRREGRSAAVVPGTTCCWPAASSRACAWSCSRRCRSPPAARGWCHRSCSRLRLRRSVGCRRRLAVLTSYRCVPGLRDSRGKNVVRVLVAQPVDALGIATASPTALKG